MYVYDRSIAGISSNPAKGMDVHLTFVVCCVGSGFCDKLITCSQETCWVVHVYVESGNLNNEVA
jgi:hypothetical protein